MGVKVTVEGLAGLEQALAQLPDATERNVIKRVLLQVAEPIQRDAQVSAPSRPASAPDEYYVVNGQRRLRQPGTLQVLVEEGSKLTPNQARLARRAGKAYVEVYVGTRDPIGRLQEHGTAHAAPHPFLRPAWDGHKAGLPQAIGDGLWVEIDKAAQRLARKAARAAAKG